MNASHSKKSVSLIGPGVHCICLRLQSARIDVANTDRRYTYRLGCHPDLTIVETDRSNVSVVLSASVILRRQHLTSVISRLLAVVA